MTQFEQIAFKVFIFQSINTTKLGSKLNQMFTK